MGRTRKVTALFLAFVMFVGLLQAGKYMKERTGARASEGGDSEIVKSDDLNEVFEVYDGKPTINKQHIIVAQPSSQFFKRDYGTINRLWSTGVKSKSPISLNADWTLSCDYQLNEGNGDVKANSVLACYWLYPIGSDGSLVGDPCLHFRNGKFDSTAGTIPSGSYGIVCGYGTQATNAVYERSKLIDKDDYKQTIQVTLKYHAEDKSFVWYMGTGEDGRKVNYVNEKVKGNTAFLVISGQIWHNQTTTPTGADVEADFRMAQYDHYSPIFEKTELVDENGKPLLDENGKLKIEIEKGDKVYVRCTLWNKNEYAGNEIVYSHVKLSDDSENYPTDGIAVVPNTVRFGLVPKNAAAEPDIAGVDQGNGVPVEIRHDKKTIFTYEAEITAEKGDKVTVGQVLTDDFFQSKRSSAATLIPELPLTPKDPDDPDPGVAGKDYNYERTKPNENGWNNTDVTVDFYKGDFDQFVIDRVVGENQTQKVKEVTATADKERVQVFKNESVDVYQYLAKNSEEGTQSAIMPDTVKIDKTNPTIKTDKDNKKLILNDGLSGIWKLEKLDSNGKDRTEVFKADLAESGGNGDKTETVTGITNGTYIVTDAAGNETVQKVYVTDTPSVTPADPEAPPLKPDTNTDSQGLRHTVIEDYLSKKCKSPYDFDGLLTKEKAKEFMESRYNRVSDAEDKTLRDKLELLDNGSKITEVGFSTEEPGKCTIQYTVTDVEGNTTTIYLHYQLTEIFVAPDVVEKGSGTILPPVTVTEDEGGNKHARVVSKIEEYIQDPPAYSGRMSAADAKVMLNKKYFIGSGIDSFEGLTFYGVQIYDLADGGKKDISRTGIDTGRPGEYLMVYKVEDSYGNTTTLEVTYVLKEKQQKKEKKLKVSREGGPDGREGGTEDGITLSNRDSALVRSSDGPQTGDPFFSAGCSIHLKMALGLLLAVVYTFLRFTVLRKRRKQGRDWRYTADYVIPGALLALEAIWLMMRECLIDMLVGALCGAGIVILFSLLAKRREEESFKEA